MAQPAASSSTTSASHANISTLYPQLESKTAPLDESNNYFEVIKIEKDLIAHLKYAVAHGNPLEDVGDCSILPTELLTNTSKFAKPKVDPLKRLKELPTDEVEEEEEEPEDEEVEDEEATAEDEEDDAGGDYLVSHFDNGEGYEDNDDEDDEMAC